MPKPKYLLLLLCAVAIFIAAPLYAADVVLKSWNLTEEPSPAWTKQGDWAYGIPLGVDGDPVAGKTGTKVYGYNLAGAYTPSIAPAKYLTTTAINCTGKYGVRLRFWRWLRVEDSAYDQATIQVSSDGTNWTTVWTNPTNKDKTADLLDSAWTQVTYDLSKVADNKATAYVRWGLASNGTDQFGGWNIDDIEILVNGDDAPFSFNMNTNPGFTMDAGWEYGPASAGGGVGGVGGDPGTDADGVAGGSIVGYQLNSVGAAGYDYEKGVPSPRYLTAGPFNCTGLTGVQLRFMRWLGIDDAKYDKVAIQATNDLTPVKLLEEKFEGGLATWTVGGDPATPAPGVVDLDPATDKVNNAAHLIGTQKITKAIDTTERYSITISYKLGAKNFEAADRLYAEYSTDAGTNWTILTAYSPSLPVACSDNSKFQIRFRMVGVKDADGDVDDGYVDDVTLTGVVWKYVWKNPAGPEGGTPQAITDSKWTEVTYSIAALADNKKTVYVRWSLGPTNSIVADTEYGGWNIDNVQILEGSRMWRAAGTTVPAALQWAKTGAATIKATNIGTATWTSDYKLLPVQGVTDTINRWGVKEVAVSGTVAPGATYSFAATLKAPPLSSIQYVANTPITWPGDPTLSWLSADWNLKNSAGWLPTYFGEDIARGKVVVSRFPDIQPGTAGGWARYWVEELNGRSPYIIQGYPDGTYRPTVVLDRAAIAVFVARAMSLTLKPFQGLFQDVPQGHWADVFIEAVADAGVVSGFGDYTYRPSLLVDRGAMAKFVALGANLYIPTDPMTAPFPDVVTVDDPKTTDVDERHPMRAYIKALKDADIVQGYPDGTYQPSWTITRDQLAVYVWRAFIRPTAAAVVLGGPAVTKEDLTTADWEGFQEVAMADTLDKNFAWVTFDAVRLGPTLAYGAGITPTWDVKFELRYTGTPTVVASATVSMTAAQINTANAAARASGVPYLTMYWAIPTGLHGDFDLVVSVEDAKGKMWEVLRKPEYVVISDIYHDDFESGIDAGWTRYGQPDTPLNWYGDDAAEVLKDSAGNATHSVEFRQTQKMARNISTTGRHHISISFSAAGANLGASDYLRVEWSKDGTNWNTVWSLNNVTGTPTKFTDYGPFNLPSGDPKATPPVVAADDNPNFYVRVGLEATTTTARGYIDNVVLRGS